MREITSATNPFVKQLRALASSKKARQESGTFIVEGWRGIDTLLRHPSHKYALETIVITPAWLNDARLPDTIKARSTTEPDNGEMSDSNLVLLSETLFEKVSDVRNAQGILGVVRHSPSAFEVLKAGCFLLLDNLRDPGNFGTLIRSAVGAGFDGILLHGDCVEPFNPKVVRATMGTFAFCPFWPISESQLDHLIADGFELCATTGFGGENLYETAFGPRIILAIGSEAHGISDALMQRAAKRITIPLRPECESLNAAIAGSICMFEIAQGQLKQQRI